MGEMSFAVDVADMPGESERAIVRSVTIPLSPEEAFRLWTTTEGIVSWLADEARVELRVGGAFEVYFLPDTPENRGARGSEGCRVLCFLPGRMLATTWNAPPTFPAERRRHTRLTVRFDPTPDGGTRLTLTHDGWPEETDDPSGNWSKVHAYFERAWTKVAKAFAAHAARSAARATRAVG